MADYEVEVLVRGRPVKTFKHKDDRFIEGRHGSSFELKIINNTWDRIEVVTSVDGLSVVNGEECGSDSEGYLVPGKESIVIPGWRLSNDKAAEFVFEDKRKSYSNQVGKGTQNVGVIGLMVFIEKVKYEPISIPTPFPYPNPPHPINPPWQPDPWYPKDPWYPTNPWNPRPQKWWSENPQWTTSKDSTGNNPLRGLSNTTDTNFYGMTQNSCDSESISDKSVTLGASLTEDSVKASAMAASAEPKFEIGTGWGDEVDHKVHEVEFEREDRYNPEKILSIFYDTRKGLEARGIQVIKTTKKKVSSLPNAFPTYKSSGCNPPPGWKGKK